MNIRPMNVIGRPKSRFLSSYRKVAFEVLAPGVEPTPTHDLKYHGGRTIPKLAYANVYVAPRSWPGGDMDRIDAALAAAMTDAKLNSVMQQYFGSTPCETRFIERKLVDGPAPRVVSQASIEKLVRALWRRGMLGSTRAADTVFNFLLPPGTILRDDDHPASADEDEDQQSAISTEDEASSLEGLGGYHGSVHIPASSGRQTVYYAVGVYSQMLPDGRENGIVAFPEPWKNVVATFYHELNEARTDPDVEDVIRGELPSSALGWTSRQGEECGDFPVFEAEPDLSKVFVEVKIASGKTVPIQLQYSNRDHGPAVS